MAKVKFELNAELRVVQGKGASRRLRRLQDKVPAIVYGGGEPPTNIAFDQKKIMHALENTAFYSHLLTLNLNGEKQQVVLKGLQRHHFEKSILHMDFLRVKPTDTIHMRVPLRFHGEDLSLGVEAGGIVNHQMTNIEVRCQAQFLPDHIDVDLSKLELDDIIHISQLTFPKGVESVALSQGPEHDHPVVSIHLPRKVEEVEEAPIKEEVPLVESEKTAKVAAPVKAPAGKATAPAKEKKGKGK